MLLWNSFPDHTAYPTLERLYHMLGVQPAANINSQGFGPKGNTCASRLSVAFNRAGAPISHTLARAAHAETLRAADGTYIIFRVAEFRDYLLRAYGRPLIDHSNPFDSDFQGTSGVIAFGVTGWNNATGHIALFNGRTYREPAHDNYSTMALG